MARFVVLPMIRDTDNPSEHVYLEAVHIENIETISNADEWTKHPIIHLNNKGYRIVNMDFESLVNKLNGA